METELVSEEEEEEELSVSSGLAVLTIGGVGEGEACSFDFSLFFR